MNKYILWLFISTILILLVSCTQEAEWDLVWADEFEQDGSPDPALWTYEMGKIRNNEMQYYTREEKNVFVQDGLLRIVAVREEGDSITSASVNTFGRKEFLYGRVEVRARLPRALGSWPAIWMLGTSHGTGEERWPLCGEIDIMENVGYDPSVIHANIHTGAYNHAIGTNKGNKISVQEPWNAFYVYALEWYEDHMDFFVDDSLYFSFANDGLGKPETWPFDKPQYLLLNLAFGGGWGGRQGVDLEALPLSYEIDYVRYYQQKK